MSNDNKDDVKFGPTFENLFFMGMDRTLWPLLMPKEGPSIDLGAGNKRFGDQNLQLPDWSWPRDKIPAEDNSVAIIHAYHFLEHLPGEDAITLLMEVERVLMPGGILQFCIPYYSCAMASQDLTHKSYWTEDSFKKLFDNKHYNIVPGGHDWKLRVWYLIIAGVVERNMALIGQLIKD